MQAATQIKNIAIASDHAGFNLKESLKQYLQSQNYNVIDVGTDSTARCDYPDFAVAACKKLQSNEVERVVLCCGSGIGVSIVANKMKGIRCALVHDYFTAEQCRLHVDCNTIAFGERVTGIEVVKQALDKFLTTQFESEAQNHVGRVEKIKKLEEELYK